MFSLTKTVFRSNIILCRFHLWTHVMPFVNPCLCKAPEIEKLDRSEFVVDIEMRDRLIAEGEEKVKQYIEDIEYNNSGCDLIWERVKVHLLLELFTMYMI